MATALHAPPAPLPGLMHSVPDKAESDTVASVLRRPAPALPLLRYAARDCLVPRRLRSFGDLSVAGDDGVASASGGSGEDAGGSGDGRSVCDTVLLARWEACFEAGLFRYDVTACPTRTLDGAYGFVSQLNEGRATKKRPTEVSAEAVCQPYDPSKFNFGKADAREVLFQFEPATRRGAAGSAAASGSAGAPGYADRATAASSSPSLVLINVSPIEYGHVLLVPSALSGLPQQLCAGPLLAALSLCAEVGSAYFRLGYNSLGAYASVNHLHFQGYYLYAPFPLERAPTAALLPAGLGDRRSRAGPAAHRTTAYPVRCLVFELGLSLARLARAVAAACERLQAAEIPFNLLIADKGARVFLIPNRFAASLASGAVPDSVVESGINPAAFECAGHLLYKRREDYDSATQATAWDLLTYASTSETEFQQLCATVVPAALDA